MKLIAEAIEPHPSPATALLSTAAYCIPGPILREGPNGSVSYVVRPLPNETVLVSAGTSIGGRPSLPDAPLSRPVLGHSPTTGLL